MSDSEIEEIKKEFILLLFGTKESFDKYIAEKGSENATKDVMKEISDLFSKNSSGLALLHSLGHVCDWFLKNTEEQLKQGDKLSTEQAKCLASIGFVGVNDVAAKLLIHNDVLDDGFLKRHVEYTGQHPDTTYAMVLGTMSDSKIEEIKEEFRALRQKIPSSSLSSPEIIAEVSSSQNQSNQKS